MKCHEHNDLDSHFSFLKTPLEVFLIKLFLRDYPTHESVNLHKVSVQVYNLNILNIYGKDEKCKNFDDSSYTVLFILNEKIRWFHLTLYDLITKCKSMTLHFDLDSGPYIRSSHVM